MRKNAHALHVLLPTHARGSESTNDDYGALYYGPHDHDGNHAQILDLNVCGDPLSNHHVIHSHLPKNDSVGGRSACGPGDYGIHPRCLAPDFEEVSHKNVPLEEGHFPDFLLVDTPKALHSSHSHLPKMEVIRPKHQRKKTERALQPHP